MVTHGYKVTPLDLHRNRPATPYPKPSKLVMRVRFPSPAPRNNHLVDKIRFSVHIVAIYVAY
jgi:hypothetical protein